MTRMLQTRTHMLVFVLLVALLAVTAGHAQDDTFRCGLQVRPPRMTTPAMTGGKHLPAWGTLRILVVFASFPDDTTFHPFWPAHHPPDSMRKFIDPDTVTRSEESFNLTHYFREMSLGQFNLIGDVLWVESPRSQNEYLNGSYGRANTDIIRERLDSLVDFSTYDQWTRVEDYRTLPQADGIVDMVVMVWRTTLFGLYGEASLGYKPDIAADGKLICMGYPESYVVSRGSGVTCEYPYADDNTQVMKTMAHEIGHWLLGGLHPYSTASAGKHQYWGILCAGERLSSCANAYERELLGWITVPEVHPDSEMIVRDFVQTGDALKFHPPNGEPEEFFYLENHQRLSVFDDATRNPDDRGLWVLHQQHPYIELDNLRIRPSDGNWEWSSTRMTSACFGSALPVFHRGDPRVLQGPSHRDQIPTHSSAVNWMYACERDTGGVECGVFLAGGSLRGAFDTAGVALFSPYSNPNSNTWSGQPTGFAIEVVQIADGAITLRSYANPLDASPARRYIGLNPAAGSHQPGVLPLAWGAEWSEGQPLESDVTMSLLERNSGDGSWETVYQGNGTTWVDESRTYDSAGSAIVAFRVKVVDSQGKASTWSNVMLARALAATGVTGDVRAGGTGVWLGEPYPNPANPISDIRYQMSDIRYVRLIVYDMLGREVAVLVNERKNPGSYIARFDGSRVASGVYICRLVTDGHAEVRKVVLLK